MPEPRPGSSPGLARFLIAAVALAASGAAAGCASAPFSQPSPGLDALDEELPYLYAEPDAAVEGLSATAMPGLGARVQNLVGTYEEELVRAEKASGGIGNTLLGIATLAVPLSGTVATVAIKNEDTRQTVAATTGAATTALVAVNLLFKPGKRSAQASTCAEFLRSAVASINERWGDDPAAIQGTPEEWRAYLSMRSALEVGRLSACK